MTTDKLEPRYVLDEKAIRVGFEYLFRATSASDADKPMQIWLPYKMSIETVGKIMSIVEKWRSK